ncbi:hypothetical protein CJU90_0689 [Yarrowia sp. C11]|nr:hypothetical protein CKK34_2101 [Yarrowia sp. E02]KAG5373024.1 hypothetical protein CJU90_0689 [Yarrowia sp. C11]
MKFSNTLLLAYPLAVAAAYQATNTAVINILQTAISNGVVDARSSDIPEEQARTEIASFVPLLLDDILLPVFDHAIDHILVDPFTVDNFPPFITEVENALEEYEKSPNFSSATSLLSLVRTHYDYHLAVQLASTSMDGYYNLLKNGILPLTDEPGPSSAIVEGLFAVTRLICQLQLTDGTVCDPYSTETDATPSSTASDAVATSDAVSAPASSGAASSAAASSAPASGSAAGSVSAFANSTVPYVDSTVVQTATACNKNGTCITADITVTTNVPVNAKQTVIETVCPKCEGQTVTITVPCEDTETEAPKPAPKPAASEGPKPKPEPKSAPKPVPQAEAPKPKPAQANGGNTWAVSTAAGIAAIAALLV